MNNQQLLEGALASITTVRKNLGGAAPPRFRPSRRRKDRVRRSKLIAKYGLSEGNDRDEVAIAIILTAGLALTSNLIRTGNARVEEGSQWEGSHDGAQAAESERLKVPIFLLGVNGSESNLLIHYNCLILLVAGVGFEPTTFGL